MGMIINKIAVSALGLLGLGATGCYYEPPPHRYVEREVIVDHGPYGEEREVVVTEGPPPPERVEVITVRPYPQAIWIGGHWIRARHGYVWIHGHWR
jgi:hypothetical protein